MVKRKFGKVTEILTILRPWLSNVVVELKADVGYEGGHTC